MKTQESYTVAHIAYALMACSLLSGLPLFIAMILAWLNRRYTQDAVLFEHYTWIIHTFWWVLVWFSLGSLLVFTVLFALIGWPIYGLAWLWLGYRLLVGWSALFSRRSPYLRIL